MASSKMALQISPAYLQVFLLDLQTRIPTLKPRFSRPSPLRADVCCIPGYAPCASASTRPAHPQLKWNNSSVSPWKLNARH